MGDEETTEHASGVDALRSALEAAAREFTETFLGDVVLPCPRERRLYDARWRGTVDADTVKCGDDATMLASTENIPAGTPAVFTVKRTSDNGTITTENGSTEATSVTDTWTSQKTSDDWNGAEVKFTVEAAGLTADSQDPQLSFHRYEDVPRTDYQETITATQVPGSNPPVNFTIQRAVIVELNDRVLIIHVPIKIRKAGDLPKRRKNEGDHEYVRRWTPSSYRTGTDDLSNADKNNLKRAIERFFTREVVLHRTSCGRHRDGCTDPISRKCCKIEIQVQVHFYNFNDTAAPAIAHEVFFWNGDGRAYAIHWFADKYPDQTHVLAHEVGHLIGFFDEYTGGGTNPASGTPWQNAAPFSLGTLMNGGEPNRIMEYYFDDYANWLGDSGRTNEAWAVIRYS